MKQIRFMSRIENINLWGINEVRYTKNVEDKKRICYLAIVIGIVLFMFVGYLCASVYGLIMLGAGEIIPTMMVFLASMIIFGFASFKAGGVLFRANGYQMLASMPISTSAIVIGRFIRLYVDSLIEAALILMPGFAIYAVMLTPGILFYPYALLVILVVPFLPLCLAVFAGILISWIASRMKHRSIWEAGLSIGFVVLMFSGMSGVSEQGMDFTMEEVKRVAVNASDSMGNTYPIAGWLGKGLIQQDVIPLLITIGLSAVAFTLVVGITTLCFHGINRLLQTSVGTRGRKLETVDLQKVQEKGIFKTLLVRDAARYFSSGVYISNTILGPIMAMAGAIALYFADFEKILSILPGNITMGQNLWQAVPFVLGAAFCATTPVSTSISMEGKEWWILKTLPLTNQMILNSKLAFNLILYAPFYLVVQVALMLRGEGGVIEALWNLILMALVIVFLCVFCLSMNLRFPKMEWDSEVVVVKQSASAGLSILGMLIMILIGFGVFLIPVSGALLHLVRALIALGIGGATWRMYGKMLKKDFRTI